MHRLNIYGLLLLLGLLSLCSNIQGKPLPEDPFEAVGMGFMTAMGTMNEVLTNGAAARRDHQLKTQFFELNSKTEVGMGDAIRQSSLDSEESSEDKRRKRSVQQQTNFDPILGEELLLPWHVDSAHERKKRAPCFGGGNTGGAGTGTGGDQTPIEPEIRRNGRNAAQKKASPKSAKSNTKKSATDKQQKKEKKFVSNRRRRQASEAEELEKVHDDMSKDFETKAQEITKRVRRFWEAIVGTMKEAVETMKQTFSSDKQGKPGEAEAV